MVQVKYKITSNEVVLCSSDVHSRPNKEFLELWGRLVPIQRIQGLQKVSFKNMKYQAKKQAIK